MLAAKSLQSCPTPCDPIDGSPKSSPVPGILQARTLEWVAISFSNAWKKSESEVAQSYPTLSNPMDCSLPGSSIHGILQARVLEWGPIPAPGKKVEMLVTQPCLTLCHPLDCRFPGSPVHGILQAKIMERVAIPFSRRSSRPRDWTWFRQIIYNLNHQGRIPTLGDLPNPGFEPTSLVPPAFASRLFTTAPPGKRYDLKVTRQS